MKDMDNKKAGFTLIEMLVGITIGLIIVATGTVMFAEVLKSQKDATSSARLNQELGAAVAIMSNEVRRAGFNVCDGCESIVYDTTNKILEFADDGSCILYRYNANLDATHDQKEHRGFRLKDDKIQMASEAGILACGNDANWIDLTDPDVIKVTGLTFSTTGSTCREMTLPNPPGTIIAHYWIVRDDTDTTKVQTGLACEDGNWLIATATSHVDYCTVTDAGVTNCVNDKIVGTDFVIEAEDSLLANHQIRIRLEAELEKDSEVIKVLETSIKVENPSLWFP